MFTCMNLRQSYPKSGSMKPFRLMPRVHGFSLRLFSSMSATWVLCQMDKKTNSRGALQLSLTPRFIILKPYNLGQIPFPLWILIFKCKRETQIFYEWFKDLMKHFSTLPGTWWDERNGSCVIAILFVTEERSRGLLWNSYILKRERKVS